MVFSNQCSQRFVVSILFLLTFDISKKTIYLQKNGFYQYMWAEKGLNGSTDIASVFLGQGNTKTHTRTYVLYIYNVGQYVSSFTEKMPVISPKNVIDEFF